MKTAIVYYSKHHGNTKKLLDAIAAKEEVVLIDVTEQTTADLSAYDRIGFASGIYYGSFAKQLVTFAKQNLPSGKKVFFLNTCGSERGSYFDSIRGVAKEKQCVEIGAYQCLGFDTFGPFKLVGGIAKGHPTQAELDGAVAFYRSLP
ncbi:MAG: flavodoxin family protein [Lachnospiraceae bacterium]|nr:flavodoxin family protein [Lachnospiraceae bacterium]